jgi:hypothetical protein
MSTTPLPSILVPLDGSVLAEEGDALRMLSGVPTIAGLTVAGSGAENLLSHRCRRQTSGPAFVKTF